jgi:HAD superfamily hydrolase (TIGR01450 family)
VNQPVNDRATVLCDLDGVVWLSGEPIPGSVAAIALLREAGHRVVFVTNSSWPRLGEHVAALARIGIAADGDVVSSPLAAATLVAGGERVLVCGGPGIVEAVERAGAEPVAGDDDAAVGRGVDAVVVGLHPEFDYHRLTLASAAIRAGARYIATNNDPLYPTPSGPVPGGGSIVAAVTTAAGIEPVVAGKPFAPMADAVRRLVGTGDRDMIMVGDMVSTDGRFASVLGCRFALVRTGNIAPGVAVDIDTQYDLADLAAVARAITSDVP